jgi:eukaryotic-like serine/threonine-protein kinase
MASGARALPPKRPASAVVTAAPAPAATTTVSPPEPRTEPRPVAASAPPASRPQQLVPPSETCKDKVFLARQFCLHEECAKPVFQNNSACVRLREEARLREESKVRN